MKPSVLSLSSTYKTLELDAIRSNLDSSHIFDYQLTNDIGNGRIRFLKLDIGLRIIEIECTLQNNLHLQLYNTDKNYLYFFYCTEGLVYHKFTNQIKTGVVEELSLSIVGNNKSSDGFLFIKNKKPVRLSIICIDQNIFFDEFIAKIPLGQHIITKTEELIKALNELNDYIYNCAKNLTFSEVLRKLKPFEVKNEFIELLDIKSDYLHLLSAYLNAFYDELYVGRSASNLTDYELQQIRKVSESILDKLEAQHTIKSLCLYSGLSAAKLQEGFKSMYGTTVSNFIRNKRLEKARQLFISTDHNVSEVVYMVGITSRSYFCKIFKAKFGLSPSLFKNKMKK